MAWVLKNNDIIADVYFGPVCPGIGWENSDKNDPDILLWTQSIWIGIDNSDHITEIYYSVHLPESYRNDGRNWKFIHREDPRVAAFHARQEKEIRDIMLRDNIENKIRNAMLDPEITDFEAERLKILSEATIT